MAFDDRSNNLVFLLSLAPVVAGCPAGDDASSGETAGTPMTGDSTGTMEGSGSGTTTTATTEADGTTTAVETEGLICDAEPPPIMGEIDPLCVAFYQQYNECYYGGMFSPECIDLYAAYCQYNLEFYVMTSGEACGTALLDLYSCLTMLACEELEMADTACSEQFAAISSTCATR